MGGAIAVLVVLVCVLGAASICMAIVLHDSKDNSRAAQRKHDTEYAPVRDVYVVLSTTNNYTTYEEHTHQDNRSIHIHTERPALGTGTAAIEPGHEWRPLPRRRTPHSLPG